MKRLLPLVGLAAGGVLTAALAIDVGLHVVYPQTVVMGPHERLGTLPRPNLSVRKAFGGHERVVTVQTNALGLRGATLPPAKTPGARRVLALGDSFTFGDAVQREEAWPHQLERRLENGRHVDVVNGGVSGSGTAHQLLLYGLLRDRLRPDVVILGFSVVNDVLDNLCVDEASYQPRRNAPCFAIEGDRLTMREPESRPSGGGRRWVPGARVAGFFSGQLRRVVLGYPNVLGLATRLGMRPELPYMPATVAAWYDDRYSAAGWRLTQRLIGELRRTLAEHGVRLVILIIPSSVQLDDDGTGKKAILRVVGGDRPSVRAFLEDPLKPQRVLLAFCAEAGIPCVDPVPALLEARRRGDVVYYPLDQHWTPAAHGIAADLVTARLDELRWLFPTRSVTSIPGHAQR